MNKDIFFDKVFLTSGCSYALTLEYLKSEINYYKTGFKTKTLVNHLGLPSGSIKHLKNSIIAFVDYYLKNGIKNENIYVIGNLTQIGRKCFKFNKHENFDILDLINKIDDYIPDLSSSELKFKKYPFGFCQIGEDIYSSLVANTEFYNNLSNDIKKRILLFLEYYSGLSFEDLVEDYFNDLFILQEYLKANKIQYTFYFMSNIIEGWDSNYTTHKYNKNLGRFEVPDLKNTFNIKDINYKVQSIFNMIDFENIACYSTDKQIFGGLDEYAIDNFTPTDFAGRENLEIKEYYGPEFRIFGQHPKEKIQIDFEKKFIYPKLKNFLEKNYLNNLL